MIIDPEDLTKPERYKLMTSVVLPRPIAWVTTLFPDGKVNAAPFSFFNGISSSPPLIQVCIGKRRDGTPKDTFANALREGEFVVNVVTRDLAEAMVATSASLDPGVSEMEEVGLAPAPSETIRTPGIAETPVRFECTLDRSIDFGGTSMIVGRVRRFHVDDAVYGEGAARFDRLRPVGRLGGLAYLDPFDGEFEIGRPG
jgi:flavin reductase (DIM6/NTAB) family NADH-FMN oxidoreductase RutF